MTDASAFTKLVPGFDFLQNLVKGAGAALPGIGQWVAPTIDPEEIDKRIKELRTVQYWLEQNTRMLEATIQALEVQRMTLSTLKTMNVQMDDLRESMKIKVPAAQTAAKAEPEAEPEAAAAPAPATAAAPGAVDPMQWWSALTKQFTELATTAMKDTGTDAAKTLAGALMKQSIDAAGQVATTAKRPATKTALKKKPAARKKAAPAR